MDEVGLDLRKIQTTIDQVNNNVILTNLSISLETRNASVKILNSLVDLVVKQDLLIAKLLEDASKQISPPQHEQN